MILVHTNRNGMMHLRKTATRLYLLKQKNTLVACGMKRMTQNLYFLKMIS